MIRKWPEHMKYVEYVQTPIGILQILADDTGIYCVDLLHEKNAKENPSLLTSQASIQLKEYFDGTRVQFELPLVPSGTDFQKKVWEALATIPFGETRSYGQIAEQIGRSHACRAVGGANHNNPIMIIIPCHRVIGANGKLVGYGGGLDVKQKLLEMESKYRDSIQNV